MDQRSLERLILWCWVVCAQCFVSAAGTGTEQALLSHAAGNPNSGSKLLYVWEYDCIFDWEPVQVRDDLTASAISWLLSLHDRLTVSRHKPLGEDLMIPGGWYAPRAASHIRDINGTRHDVSLRAVIEAQLEKDPDSLLLPKYLLVIFQLSLLPNGPHLKDVYVTTAQTFWHTVEATAASGQLVYAPDIDTEQLAIAPITGYAVAIPTMSAIHGQDSWTGAHVTAQYGDHSEWKVDTLVEMLTKFFAAANAVSLPELAEYHWRLDKVIMHHMLQDYYNEDPQNRTPHIPSVVINPPVSSQTQSNLCYSSRYLNETLEVTEADIHATAVALLVAAQQLEADSDAAQIQEANQEADSTQPVRKYFLKRNYSAGAKNVLSFTLTSINSWHSEPQQPQPVSHSSSAQELSQPATNATASDMLTDTTHKHSSIQQTNLAKGAAAQQPYSTSGSDQSANATTNAQSTIAVLHDAQQLFKTAERLIRESCNEQWLLQPFIPDMERNEYRVYLIGGAEATGKANDTAAVYTPAFHQYNEEGKRQVYVWNVTLPEGFFSRAPLQQDPEKLPWLTPPSEIDQQDLNSTHMDQFTVPYFPYPIWRDEAMHSLVMHVALSAADAIAKSGRPIRMAQHVMLRVDIAMTRHGRMAKPYINEAHVFNDAGLSFDVWPPSNSNIQDEFTASLTQACNAEQQQAEDGQSSTDNQQCSTRGCSSGSCGAFSAQSYLSSRDHTGPVCKDGSNSTCQASAQSEAGSADVGRGYLLAAKLWQEALLTLAASASDQKP